MRKTRTPRLLLTGAALTLAAAAAVPAPADAATISREGSTFVLRGDGAEANYLSFRKEGDKVQFSERSDNPLNAGSGVTCEITGSSWGRFADCDIDGATAVRIEGGDGNDQLNADPRDLPFGATTMDGGNGDDKIDGPALDAPTVQRGGEGNDTLTGGYGSDDQDGGNGNDKVDGSNGNDQVRGGAGDDNVLGGQLMSTDLVDGGPGTDVVDGDWVDPGTRDQPLRVTLDGVADDGRPGEGDNVIGVEKIETRRVAYLAAGGDAVDFAVTNTPGGSSTLLGSPANDKLRASSFNDRVEGGAGADAIAAGGGDDTIVGGPGPDTILADGGVICDFLVCQENLQGNDTIDARDGEKDSIDCGNGTDVANVDPVDVTSGCETVNGATPAPPGGGTPRGGSGTKRKGCVVPAIKRGITLKTAQKKLKAAGCRTKVRRVKSRMRKGRVVSLNRKVSGKTRKLAAKTKLSSSSVVLITVSRGRR